MAEIGIFKKRIEQFLNELTTDQIRVLAGIVTEELEGSYEEFQEPQKPPWQKLVYFCAPYTEIAQKGPSQLEEYLRELRIKHLKHIWDAKVLCFCPHLNSSHMGDVCNLDYDEWRVAYTHFVYQLVQAWGNEMALYLPKKSEARSKGMVMELETYREAMKQLECEPRIFYEIHDLLNWVNS